MARLFDILETPAKGWSLRRIEQRTSTDHPPMWLVEIMRDRDGVALVFENESLHVAWVRCTARADSMEAGVSDHLGEMPAS